MKRALFITFLKAQLATLVFLGIFVFLSILIVLALLFFQYRTFLQAADIKHQDFTQLLTDSIHTYRLPAAEYFTLVLLGVDQVELRDQPPLSDTLMVLSLHRPTFTVSSVSIPRDYWLDLYQTKINALYYYSIQKSDTDPLAFFRSVIEETLGIQPDTIIVIRLEQLADLVDILDGIEVTVPERFVDEHFPQSGVDPSIETDVSLLQKTVVFEAGTQSMSGERVLEYIRSRQAEGEVGTDTDRTKRQQAVLSAIVAKLQSKIILNNPETLGKLYRWYGANYQSQLPLNIVISDSLRMVLNNLKPSFRFINIPIADNSSSGILYHPPNWMYQNQWVYTATDSAVFKQFIMQNLYTSPK